MHRRTPSETQRLRHLAAESAQHAAPCHGDGASGAHLRSLRSSFALHVVRHVLWTASRSKSSTQQHRTSSPWPLIRRSYTTPGHSLHRDTDCTVTCAKMATDNSLRGRRFRDTVPCPPPTQPTGWAGGGHGGSTGLMERGPGRRCLSQAPPRGFREALLCRL